MNGSKQNFGVRRRTPGPSRSRSQNRSQHRSNGQRAAGLGVPRRTPIRSRQTAEPSVANAARCLRGLAALRRRCCAAVRPRCRPWACEMLTETCASGLVHQRRGRRKPPPTQWDWACGRTLNGRSAPRLCSTGCAIEPKRTRPRGWPHRDRQPRRDESLNAGITGCRGVPS